MRFTIDFLLNSKTFTLLSFDADALPDEPYRNIHFDCIGKLSYKDEFVWDTDIRESLMIYISMFKNIKWGSEVIYNVYFDNDTIQYIKKNNNYIQPERILYSPTIH